MYQHEKMLCMENSDQIYFGGNEYSTDFKSVVIQLQ